MPKVSKEQLAARRRQIMDAATACFERQGFHQTTMHDICTQAGLSPGAVYRYFNGKEEIISAACEEGRERLAARFAELEQHAGSGVAAIDAAAGHFFRSLADDGATLDLEIWAEALRSAPVGQIILENQEAAVARITHLVERAQAEDDMPSELNAVDAARVLLSLFLGLQVQRALGPADVDIEGYLAAMRALFDAPIPLSAGGAVTAR